MKKLFCALLIALLLLASFACSTTAQPAAESAAPSVKPTEAPTPETTAVVAEAIVFTDPYFEDAVRIAMGKPDGDITTADAKALTVLSLANADWEEANAENGGIKDISDLKYFPNLTELHLDYNAFADFSPVSTLTNLTVLTFNGVRANDLTPLSSLTKMVTLVFDWSYSDGVDFKGYGNLDFMRNMKDLEIFEAKKAGITDISVLTGLPKLWSVFLDENLITDISPLAQIKTIREFLIADNPIADYSVLEPVHEVFPNLDDGFQPNVDLK